MRGINLGVLLLVVLAAFLVSMNQSGGYAAYPEVYGIDLRFGIQNIRNKDRVRPGQDLRFGLVPLRQLR